MIVRVGIPEWTGRLVAEVAASGAPALVSSGRMWSGGRMRVPAEPVKGVADVALDSAGFVAMVKHGGYPWSVHDYLKLVASRKWAWWSQMDYCCEPQVAADRDIVTERVHATADAYALCATAAQDAGLPAPLPVLQGWRPDDYAMSADLLSIRTSAIPPLVGVGSVCRRALTGPDGLPRVVERILRVLPQSTGLHLFGVKGAALEVLGEYDRVVSVDSCAWDFAARKTERAAGRLCRMPARVEHLQRFIRSAGTVKRPPQLRLW